MCALRLTCFFLLFPCAGTEPDNAYYGKLVLVFNSSFILHHPNFTVDSSYLVFASCLHRNTISRSTIYFFTLHLTCHHLCLYKLTRFGYFSSPPPSTSSQFVMLLRVCQISTQTHTHLQLNITGCCHVLSNTATSTCYLFFSLIVVSNDLHANYMFSVGFRFDSVLLKQAQ